MALRLPCCSASSQSTPVPTRQLAEAAGGSEAGCLRLEPAAGSIVQHGMNFHYTLQGMPLNYCGAPRRSAWNATSILNAKDFFFFFTII